MSEKEILERALYQLKQPPTLIHCLGFIYLYFAHTSDEELTKEEFMTVNEKVNQWMDLLEEDGDSMIVFQDTFSWWKSEMISDDVDINKTILYLVENLSSLYGLKDVHLRIIGGDLMAIAEADGKESDFEKSWIMKVLRKMGLEGL